MIGSSPLEVSPLLGSFPAQCISIACIYVATRTNREFVTRKFLIVVLLQFYNPLQALLIGGLIFFFKDVTGSLQGLLGLALPFFINFFVWLGSFTAKAINKEERELGYFVSYFLGALDSFWQVRRTFQK